MKIKRFFASDIRQAMRLVREEQGPEAVILSNRRVDGGVEIIAAVDYDEALIHQALGARLPRAASRQTTAVDEDIARPENSTPVAEEPLTPERHLAQIEAPILMDMQNELAGLRSMLEGQLASLTWNSMGREQPVRARALRDLSNLGVESELARQLVERMPAGLTAQQAWHVPLGMLARAVPVAEEELIDTGGAVALIGPTGVGKTTTIAKLAARFALRHGHRHIALVTTDGFRIGAEEHLFTFGRLLGVPVYAAHEPDVLHEVLDRLASKKLVLIDTTGMSHRDARLAEQFRALNATHRIRPFLVLAANAQTAALDEVITAYRALEPAGCLLSKLDEAAELGGALSVVTRHKLAVQYVTDGQRVPEDLEPANAQKLVCRAIKHLKQGQYEVSETLLAERFGRLTTASA